jgi:hypothetical protein
MDGWMVGGLGCKRVIALKYTCAHNTIYCQAAIHSLLLLLLLLLLLQTLLQLELVACLL